MSEENLSTLSNAEKHDKIIDILETVAEKFGDITPLVTERYYQIHPQGQTKFEYYGCNHAQTLEGLMVEQALYCTMIWFEQPQKVYSIITGTIPIHESHDISAQLFKDYWSCYIDTLAEAVPSNDTIGLQLLQEFKKDSLSMVDEAAE